MRITNVSIEDVFEGSYEGVYGGYEKLESHRNKLPKQDITKGKKLNKKFNKKYNKYSA